MNDLDLRGYDKAYENFHLHAKQRIHFFNFFIIISGVLMTTIFTNFFSISINSCLITLVGLTQILISYVFYKFDERNKYLTKHSENIIMQYEEYFTNEKFKLLTSQEEKTVVLRKTEKGSKFFLCRQLSFSKLINHMYFAFGLVGLCFAIASHL